MKARKRNKGKYVEKEETELSYLANDTVVCGENSKEPPKVLPELLSEFRKVAGYKVNIHKSIRFCISEMNNWKLKQNQNNNKMILFKASTYRRP